MVDSAGRPAGVKCDPLSLRRRTFIQEIRILSVEELSARRTRKIIREEIGKYGWEIGKSVHRRRKYHVFYAVPRTEVTDEQRIISAIGAIHDVQHRIVELAAKNTIVPKPVVLQFVMSPVEDFAHYPFRLAVLLPPWLHLSPSVNYIENMNPEKAKRVMSRIRAYIRVGNAVLPVAAFSKKDLVFKKPLEDAIEQRAMPAHVVTGGNIHESVGISALIQEIKRESPRVKIAKNVYLVVPNPRNPKYLRQFGSVVTEFDGLATDGKNVHPIEVKSVGIRTMQDWDRIVRRKAISMTPAMEYLLQMLIDHPNRLRPHFVVVANSEEDATNLANRALITLKPAPKKDGYQKPHPFERLKAHAVWPHMGKILIRSFHEPLW